MEYGDQGITMDFINYESIVKVKVVEMAGTPFYNESAKLL
jgi:hypothetical protein